MRRKAVSNITVKKRLIFLFFCLAAAVAGLIVRLGYIHFVMAGELQRQAMEQWMRGAPAQAKRGQILDTKGRILAGSAASFSVLAYPAQISDKDDAAWRLAPVLEMEEEKVRELIGRQSSSVYLKRRADEDLARAVRELNIRGIHFPQEPKRYYPHGRLASQLLGFVGIDQGWGGLESRYEDELKGVPGRYEFQADGRGRQVPQGISKFVPPKDGHNLILTIDQSIQFIMEQEMDRAMLELEPKGIISIAVNPKTGEILAIAGKPDFDPNNYNEYPEETRKLTPITNTFEPGSTFKLVTLAASIEEGKYKASEGFFCPGFFRIGGHSIGCWTRGRGGHGAIDFTKAVLGSCNPAFITLGQRIGADKLMEYVKAFGFGEKTGVDVIGEGTGILFSPKQYGPVEAATTSFGQGVSVTPLQQVMAVAAMANGGDLLRPYVVKEVRDADGNLIRKQEPQVVRRVVSKETSREVVRIMELVTTEGSGKNAQVEGYRIAGKTGTAQKVGPGGRYIPGEFILSFVGFAPAEDPQILLYIAVDAPQVGPQWGSQVAAPISRRMMERMLKYLNIPPSTAKVNEPLRLTEVPDLIGKTLEEADILVDTTGLLVRFVGSGDKILNQTPKPGARVPLHTQVLVYLGPGVAENEVVVPDVTGKTMREAGEILGWLGLRINSTGSGVAVRQDPKPQTRVKANSVVHVEFAAPGETAR